MTATGSSKIIWWCCLFLIGSFIINYCDCGALEKELKELADDEDENDLEATDILRSALCKHILFIFILCAQKCWYPYFSDLGSSKGAIILGKKTYSMGTTAFLRLALILE